MVIGWFKQNSCNTGLRSTISRNRSSPLKQLLQVFGTLEKAWSASQSELRMAGIPEKSVQLFAEFRSQTDPGNLLRSIQNRGISVLTWEDPDYPPLLKQIEAPPPVLYFIGKIPGPDAKFIAIVGTRRMTNYGRSMAEEISGFLAAHGVVIISGLARGIDGIAHQAALDRNGRTVAVLGSGVDVIYPPEHRLLASKIRINGALISDYPPGTPPDRMNFPPRNRIFPECQADVSLLSRRKIRLVDHCRFAAEQGREVFVLPGNFNAPQSQEPTG